jgi:hypothetical protein
MIPRPCVYAKLALDYLSQVITFRHSALHLRGTHNFSPQLEVLALTDSRGVVLRSVHRVVILLLRSGPFLRSASERLLSGGSAGNARRL